MIWFVFFVLMVSTIIIYSNMSKQIEQLRSDMRKLQADLQQQKNSFNFYKSEQATQFKSPTQSASTTDKSSETLLSEPKASKPKAPQSTALPPLSATTVANQEVVTSADNKKRNDNYPIYSFVKPKLLANPLYPLTQFTRPVAETIKPLAKTTSPQATRVASTTVTDNTATQARPQAENIQSISHKPSDSELVLAKKDFAKPVMEPDERSLPIVTSLFNSLKNWFLGGNLVVRVGVLVLLIGVVLLLRLVSEYFETPIEVKLAAIAIVGFGLAGLGLKLASKRFAYGITLQGAGLAIAYLTTFFAYNVYEVLASVPSFIALGVISALTIGLAVRQNAFPLALLALGGGFFAPLLTATDTGSLTALFSYYLLLNVAVAIIAHYRTWKVLNVLGVAVSFGLAYYFGGFATTTSEIDAQRWSLVLLVALHLALYLFIAVRYTQQIIAYNVSHEANASMLAATSAAAPAANTKSVKAISSLYLYPMDIGLLFSVPVLAFGLFAALLHDIEQALTITSAILGAVYLGLGWLLIRRSQRYALITEGMLALGFGFLALVVPLAFDAEWIAVGWSIQGVALVWFGRRSLRAWLVIFGLLLQIVSVGLLFLYAFFGDATPLAMTISAIAGLGAMFILRASNSPSILLNVNLQSNNNIPSATDNIDTNIVDNIANNNGGLESYASSLGISSQAARHWLASINSQSAAFSMIWRSPAFISFLTFIAIIWTLYVLITDFDIWFNDWQLATTTLVALATLVSLTLYWAINRYRAWAEVSYFSHGLLSLFYLALIIILPQKFEFNQQWSVINWTVFAVLLVGWVIVAQLWLKTWFAPSQDTNKKINASLSLYHFATWLGAGILVLAAAVYYGLADVNGVMTALATSLCLIVLIPFAKGKFTSLWPWFDWHKALVGCSFIFIPLLLFWVVATNGYHDGIVWNLPYIPVLNLYDIAIFTVIAYGLGMYHLYMTIQANCVANKTANANAMPLADWATIVIYAIAIVGFWALSSILVRTLHAYAGTPLWIDGALFNDKVQISLAIMWTLSAFFIQRKLPDLLANFAWFKAFDWQKILVRFSYLLIPLAFSWVIISNVYHDGVVWDIPYIPILNLYDIAVLLTVAYGIHTYYLCQNTSTAKQVSKSNSKQNWANIVLKATAIIGFWALSSILVRTLHAYAGTPLWINSALFNDKVQISLIIMWTLSMFFIQRKLPDLLSNFAWLKAFNWQKAIQKAVMVSSYLFVPVLLSWVVITNWYHSGVVWGLPYIPVLNLYDIAVLLAMGYGLNIYYAFQNSYSQNSHTAQGSLNSSKAIAANLSNNINNISKRMNMLLKVLGIISFWVLSSMLVRTLHAYASTPLWTDGAWGDDKVQTSLTILWTLTALIATFISSRNGKRFWWFMGIGLLGVVVVKLVLVDLSQTGAILRVVSFLVAGSLILLIGYLAPLPPEHDKEVKKGDDSNTINDSKNGNDIGEIKE